jgi:hypothetical protein
VGREASSTIFGRGQIDQQAVAVTRRAVVGGQRHAERAGGANGRRAAHSHLADALSYPFDRVILHNDKLSRQQPLVDHLDFVDLPKTLCASSRLLCPIKTPFRLPPGGCIRNLRSLASLRRCEKSTASSNVNEVV